MGLLVFFGWWVFDFTTGWIGRSTAPEDTEVAKDRLGQFVDWLLSTPGWVPGSLAIIFGTVVLFPHASWTAFQAMRGKLPADRTPETVEPISSTQIEARNEPPETADVGPFLGGGLLGGPLGSAPIGALHGSRLPPAPPRTDPETEHENKKAAKEALIKAAKNYFGPAYDASHKLRHSATKLYTHNIPKGPTLQAIIWGLSRYDLGIKNDNRPSVEHLKNADRVRAMTLFEAESAYYYNYCWYARSVEFALNVMSRVEGAPKALVDQASSEYSNWLGLHQKFVDHNSCALAEFIDLNTIPKMTGLVHVDWSAPNWESISRK